VDDHRKWSKDIEETQGAAVNYPMIGDPDLQVAKLYDMLPAENLRRRFRTHGRR
jgi:alkyl hydroperoxide reductase subunit AhpC